MVVRVRRLQMASAWRYEVELDQAHAVGVIATCGTWDGAGVEVHALLVDTAAHVTCVEVQIHVVLREVEGVGYGTCRLEMSQRQIVTRRELIQNPPRLREDEIQNLLGVA